MSAELDRKRALAAAARIQARRKGVRLAGLKIKDLIEEGRRPKPDPVTRIDNQPPS